jgi:uncharacterized protein (UPF0261 family)
MSRIAVVGTLDTKGAEHQFVADLITEKGHTPILVDVGGLDPASVTPHVPRELVAKSAGIDIEAIVARRDRGALVSAMSKAAASYINGAFRRGEIEGIISLGGSGGTAIATAAMRALPIGFPKVMVSTMASGDVQGYVGEKDIVMIPSIVDVAGLNRFSRVIFSRAAGAICGMVDCDIVESDDRPIIVASMFGNTTECVQSAQKTLESAGYEVLVFHSTGAGGRTMESLIESGMVAGVLDVTTTELADELMGGVLSAGPNRLEAAARKGVPAVVAPGCLDMVNFGSSDSVPPSYKDRNLYPHNPQVTLMRTSTEESLKLGEVIAGKLNESIGPVTVLLPLKGLSVIGAEGEPFYSPEADQALFQSIREHLREGIEIIEVDALVNDPAFSDACVRALMENIAST